MVRGGDNGVRSLTACFAYFSTLFKRRGCWPGSHVGQSPEDEEFLFSRSFLEPQGAHRSYKQIACLRPSISRCACVASSCNCMYPRRRTSARHIQCRTFRMSSPLVRRSGNSCLQHGGATSDCQRSCVLCAWIHIQVANEGFAPCGAVCVGSMESQSENLEVVTDECPRSPSPRGRRPC